MRRHSVLTNGFLVQLAIVMLMRLAMFGQAGATRTPISQSAVAELLDGKGLHIEASRVHLPTRILANSTSPELRVVSADKLGKGQMLVGVRCETAGDCMPFNATIDISSQQSVTILKKLLAPAVSPGASGSKMLTSQADPKNSLPALQRSKEVKVKLGSAVTLVIREGRMEIHLPAVAMDSGSPGMRVRVRTAGSRKTFSAVVLDESTVLGAAQ